MSVKMMVIRLGFLLIKDIFGGDGGYDGVMDMVMIVVLCTDTYQHQECWRC